MVVRILPLLVAALVTALPTAAHAQLRARLLASGFNRPNGVVFDPVVPGAIHLVDQSGVVRTFLNGAERPTPFLDLRGVVSGGNDERGLLGLAFPPDAAATGRVFVNFTNRTGAGNTVIARFTRSAADPLVVDPASRFDLRFPDGMGGVQPFITQDFSNHNGGNLVFGPDGYLYIGMGDGGSGNDPNNRAQTPNSLLGKMLRLDVSGTPPNGYTNPPTNPTFPTMTQAFGEIWSFGLRNPWRYSFDDVGPGATNALIIGDVGQGDREEINIEPTGQGGRNYGWRQFEGTLDNNNVPQLGLAYGSHQRPAFEYTHAVGQAITGGYVYRGTALGAAYQGRYFYADCVQGKIFSLGWSVDGVTGEPVAGTNTEHTSELGGPFQCIGAFARDPNGELYFMDFGYSASNTGRVFRIENGATAPPSTPVNISTAVQGNRVTITWMPAASGSAPTSYLVEAGTTLGATNVGTFAVTGTTLAADGVPPGGYYVRIRARNANGTSAPTGDYGIAVGCSFPVAPQTPTATVAGQTVTLGWTVASGTARTILEAGQASGFVMPLVSLPFDAPQAGVAFPGVPPGTYYVRTRAANACGTSAPSAERVVVVQ